MNTDRQDKIEFLSGNYVRLRMAKPSDYPTMQAILSDPVTMEHLKFMTHAPIGWTLEQVQERYDKRKKYLHDQFATDFIVELKDSKKVVGDCGIFNIDTDHHRAEFGIVLHHSVWGTPVASECHLLCLQYAFETLKFHRLEWSTSTENKRMRRFLENIDAENESTRKDYWLVDGNYRNDSVYVLFANQWDSARTKLLSKIERKSIKTKPEI